jgi:hypothetical protein
MMYQGYMDAIGQALANDRLSPERLSTYVNVMKSQMEGALDFMDAVNLLGQPNTALPGAEWDPVNKVMVPSEVNPSEPAAGGETGGTGGTDGTGGTTGTNTGTFNPELAGTRWTEGTPVPTGYTPVQRTSRVRGGRGTRRTSTYYELVPTQQ